jgi:hypothetical protein
VDQTSNTHLSKNKVAATPGRAAITEVAALPVALHKEVEVVIAVEAVARASEEEEVVAAEVKEEDVVVVAGTEASMPMLRRATRAMAAWSIRNHDGICYWRYMVQRWAERLYCVDIDYGVEIGSKFTCQR